MKILYVLLIVLCSCTTKATRFICSCEDRTKMEQFISKNVKDSNNTSDEETEDVIAELRKTSLVLYCNPIIIEVNRNDYTPINDLNLDSCETMIPYYYQY